MKGHIRKRGERSWALVVELDRDPATGRRRQRWHSVKGTKRDAERKLRELLNSIDQGTYVKPAKLTVGEFLQQWLRDYAAVSVRPRTSERYESIIRNHLIPSLGAIHLTDLQPSHIQACHARALSHGRLDGKEGGAIRFDQVLLLVDGDKVTIGRPLVKGAVVKAKIIEQFKGKKVRVATYKAKSRYRRVLGHRKHLTKLQVQTIGASETAKKAVSKKTKS